MDRDPHTERTVVERRDPLIGGILDRRFRVEARIAAGGFGAIYRATHLKSGHEFALKVLHPNLTTEPGVVARFRREGAALTRLRDPHTITAYELGEASDGTLYIVMELLRGETLYERFRKAGPLRWQRMMVVARAVCSSLAEAHALGIIHRDLKPTNIHLEPRDGEDDAVKVLDFGIAKILQHSEIDATELTDAGQMIGTLDYMSPEQMVGGMCTAASDLYTLGIVMYEMIAGRKPYDDANSGAAALAAVLTKKPIRLSKLAPVPPGVEHVIMRCLERQHTQRFQSAAELASALDDLLPNGDEAVTTVATSRQRSSPVLPRASPAELAPSPPDRAPPAAAARPATPRAASAGEATTRPASSRASSVHEAATRPAPSRASSVHEATTRPASSRASSVHEATTRPASSRASSVHEAVTRPAATREPLPALPVDDAAPSPAVPRPAPLGSKPVAAPRAPGPRPSGTPHVGTPIVPIKNLREAYPEIHRPPPSPLRLPASVGGDQAVPRATPHALLETARISRRGTGLRRLALVLGIAVAALVGALLVTQV